MNQTILFQPDNMELITEKVTLSLIRKITNKRYVSKNNSYDTKFLQGQVFLLILVRKDLFMSLSRKEDPEVVLDMKSVNLNIQDEMDIKKLLRVKKVLLQELLDTKIGVDKTVEKIMDMWRIIRCEYLEQCNLQSC